METEEQAKGRDGTKRLFAEVTKKTTSETLYSVQSYVEVRGSKVKSVWYMLPLRMANVRSILISGIETEAADSRA